MRVHTATLKGLWAAIALLVSVPAAALSLDLEGLTHKPFALEDSPLFLGNQAPANVLFLYDESMSMSANMALSHRDSSGDVEKTNASGQRENSRDWAQGMARGSDNGRLLYPWLAPLTPSAQAICRNNSELSADAMAALRLPDEVAPFCGQIMPSQALLDILSSDNPDAGSDDEWVRNEAGIAAKPERKGDTAAAWKLRSHSYNPLYFDPDKTYAPWPGVDSAGVAFADANPTAVRLDPYSATGSTIDIKTPIEVDSIIRLADGSYDTVTHRVYTRETCSVTLLGVCTLPGPTYTHDVRYKLALYYKADGTAVDLSGLASNSPELINFANWFQYYRSRDLVAKGTTASAIALMTHTRVALASTHQNDARAVAAAEVDGAASAGAKKTVLDNLYQMQPAAAGTPLRRALDEAVSYYRCGSASRNAAYYSSSASNEAFNVVGDSSCPILPEADGGSCQVNHVVVVSDGYSTAHGVAVTHTGYPAENGEADEQLLSHNQAKTVTDHDSDADSDYDGEPYADALAGTAADAAMDGYENDLQASIDGRQAMNSHAILVSGELASAAVADIMSGIGNWPSPLFAAVSDAPHEPAASDAFAYASLITELRHVTENGRGAFLSGLSQNAAVGLISTLNSINGSALTGANTVASAAFLRNNTYIYSSSYDFESWNGNLVAYTLGADGALTEAWNAAEQLKSDSGRVILTYDPRRKASISNTGYKSGGIAFTYEALQDAKFLGGIPLIGGIGDDLANILGDVVAVGPLLEEILSGGLLGSILGGVDAILSAISDAVGSLIGGLNTLGLDGLLSTLGISDGFTEAEINYIRGDRSNEQQNGGALRNRYNTVLGPIFSSNPVYVGPPGFDYPDEFENPDVEADRSYYTFAQDYANRAPMIYVGGNDGMVHGFDAATGEERIAFVPSRVLSKLRDYPDSGFTPTAYVDGQISVVDVFGKYPGCAGSNPCWRSILVGSLGRGGQGIYALDVTDPGSYDASGNYSAGSFSESNAAQLVLWEFTDAGSLTAQAKDLVNGLLQDALCDALLGLCDLDLVLVPDLGTIIEDYLGEAVVEPLLDLLLQNDEERGHVGMGYTFGHPDIVHTKADFGFGADSSDASGDWAVVMSNGYNNTELDLGLQDADTSLAYAAPLSVSVTGNAYLYAIDLETGILVKTFDTEVGAFLDLAEVLLTPGVEISLPDLLSDNSSLLQSINLPVSRPNGLATAATVDVDRDLSVDYAYAGDLVGNLWKIDFTDANGAEETDESKWDFAQKQSGDPLAFFQATNFSGVPQPITTEPMVMWHPDYPVRDGQLLLFGTGEMLEADSAQEITRTQSIYGLWDQNLSTALPSNDKSKYLRRYIYKQVEEQLDNNLDGTQEATNIRFVSDNLHDGDGDGKADGPLLWDSQVGWYLDLAVGENATAVDNADNLGERVVADPVLRNGRLLIASTIPVDTVCEPGIRNWLYELDARDGSPTYFPPFDLNGDGALTFDDRYTDDEGNQFTPSGRETDGTYNPIPTILINAQGQEVHFTAGADGSINRTVVNPMGFERSRATWRQLR